MNRSHPEGDKLLLRISTVRTLKDVRRRFQVKDNAQGYEPARRAMN
jgi:hypothetical protein